MQVLLNQAMLRLLREAAAHPEWFDLSDRTMVLFAQPQKQDHYLG